KRGRVKYHADREHTDDELVAEALAFRDRLLPPALDDDGPKLMGRRDEADAPSTDEIVAEALDVVDQVLSRTAGHEVAQPHSQSHETYSAMRMAHFRTMANLITGLMMQGRIVLSDEDVHQIGLLKTAIRQMLQHAQGDLPCPPQRQALHHRILTRAGDNPDPVSVRIDERLKTFELAYTEHSARRALISVLQSCLPAVLEEVRNVGTLFQLAQDLVAELRHTLGPKAIVTSAAFAQTQTQALQSIQRELQLAGAESELQKDLLQTLGLAATELGQAKVRGLHGGLNHAARGLLSHHVVQRAGGDPRPRTEQVRASLEPHLGQFLSFGHSGQPVNATLKDDAPGYLSEADFEQRLSELLHIKKPKLVAQEIGQAVDGSADYERSQVNGQDAVSLKPRALDRLAALSQTSALASTPEEKAAHKSLLHCLALAAHDLPHRVLDTILDIRHDPDSGHVHVKAKDKWAQSHPDELLGHLNLQLRTHRAAGDHTAVALLESALRGNVHLEARHDAHDHLLHVRRHSAPSLPDAPARERLADIATKTQRAIYTAILKLSLLQSFDGLIKARVASSDESVPWHRELRQAKDELLVETLEDLMASATPEQMLQQVAKAQIRHDALWRDTWKCPNGGRTGSVLKDLRAAVERF
ncbi:hypothetical protein PI87_21835, partial [Ralstonia sp. A12]|uniref:hypothetical protein n=1 Tax=Ralstonia sp. A12 TaxID=1217052 RepID=UPI00057511F0